jgi:hypothetical protein
VSEVRLSGDRADAHECLPVLLCLQGMRRDTEARCWRLLRILLVRLGALSAHAGSGRVCARVRTRAAPRVSPSRTFGCPFTGRDPDVIDIGTLWVSKRQSLDHEAIHQERGCSVALQASGSGSSLRRIA